MKQHITIDQLNEISEKGKTELKEWWKPRPGNICTCGYAVKLKNNGNSVPQHFKLKNMVDHLPLLSIGQMIEFLGEHRKFDISNYLGSFSVKFLPDVLGNTYDNYKELCDALWEAVKEVLNTEN